ncbi:MAG: C25 family cysteine peptidase [Anaerolineae bacterium]
MSLNKHTFKKIAWPNVVRATIWNRVGASLPGCATRRPPRLLLRLTATVAVLAAVLGGGAVWEATAQGPQANGLTILSTGENAIVLELTVPDFEVETITQQGDTFQRLRIPGAAQLEQPGRPQVPVRGVALGIPSAKGVAVEVLEAESQILPGYRLPPAPGWQASTAAADGPVIGEMAHTAAPSPARYAADAFFPPTPVEIGGAGLMRGQAVAQVQFYPVQYNPLTGDVRFFRRLRVKVTWEPPSSPASGASVGAAPAFEPLLRETLFNYSSLQRPAIAAPAAPPRPATGPQKTTAATQTLKIGVTEQGIYRLTPADLTGTGFTLSGVGLDTLKLTNRGAEVAIFTFDDNGNNAFDGNDYLLFYGTPITDIYTTKNIYWLQGGGSAGQRMAANDGTITGGGSIPNDYPATARAEEDTLYWFTMPNGEGEDHWFWDDRISPATSGLSTFRDYPVLLNHVSAQGITATVRVRLKGFTSLGHRTRIYLNGTEVDDQSWNGQITFNHTVITAPHSLLQSLTNTIRVEALDSGDALPHQTLVNRIEIGYRGAYTAENDNLYFGVPATGTFEFAVSNFSTATVQVFDVTDPAAPAVISNPVTVDVGGSYELRFEDSAPAQTQYLALTPALFKSPAAIELDEPSSLRNPLNGADYILITHPKFYTSALTLANYRAITSGLRVATVKIDDVYDEFNDGIFNPQAIKDFLAYAYRNWTPPAPTYVLLAGSATFDYRDIFGDNKKLFVPTKLVETDLLGQTPSDNWFTLVSGDDILPDLLIGRITGQTSTQIDNAVEKIIAYEQTPPADPWNKEALLVADDDESSFETISNQLAAQLPYYYTPHKVFLSNYPQNPFSVTVQIRDQINSGTLLVNYTGHGNADKWAQEAVFGNSDISALANAGKYPVVTIANCLNGFFVDGDFNSMAETFIQRGNGGAVAVWAPTGLGYPSGHRTLMREFYDAIFQEDQYSLGLATTSAKLNTYALSSLWAELIETFVLFGDPATQLGLPTNYPYVQSTSPVNGATGVAVDQELTVYFSKPMSPTSVSLGGPGTLGPAFTPAWSDNNTVLRYSHPNFAYGQTFTFTVTGQDNLGNPLGAGPAPLPWSFTVINGAQTTISQTQGGSLVFTATDNSVTRLTVPAGAFTGTILLRFTVEQAPVSLPVTLTHVAPHAFILEAFRNGAQLYTWPFSRPVTVSLTYSDSVQNEPSLEWRVNKLFPPETVWVPAANTCDPPASYTRNPAANQLSLPLCGWGDTGELVLFKELPTLLNVTPAGGAANVPVDRDIQLTFSKPMSPATVNLGGQGTLGLVFTPTWNAAFTATTFGHTDFPFSRTLTFTLRGQDNAGNPLVQGPISNTWSFTVAAENYPVFLPLIIKN